VKASVLRLEEFDGWDFMLSLVEECRRTPYKAPRVLEGETAEEYVARLIRRDQALIATLFETGGRVSEVIQLRRRNFQVGEEAIIVTGMKVLKRYEKVKEYEDDTGRVRWITRPVFETRGRFPILVKEPLVLYLLPWLDETEDYLFPSSAAHRDHIDRSWAYKIVRRVGDRLGRHIWPHYFRSQRASQLVQDYGFNLHQLLRFFNWKNIPTALRYAKMDERILLRAMQTPA